VRLSELYLHHWIMAELSVPKEQAEEHLDQILSHMRAHHEPMPYEDSLGAQLSPFPSGSQRLQTIAKGGETRHTDMSLPEPYVIESGQEVDGHETLWMLNVHGLDTRGAVNAMGCAECRFASFLTLTFLPLFHSRVTCGGFV
jgi:hypothetical protein